MSGATLPDNAVYDTDANEAVVLENSPAPKAGQNDGPVTGNSEQKPGQRTWTTAIGDANAAVDRAINDAPVVGFTKRQIVSNALPAATGAAGAAGATALLGGATALSGGTALIPIIAGLGIAGLTRYAQDKARASYAERNPESQEAQTFRRTIEEEAAHPYLSAIAAAPAAGFGGGRFVPMLRNLSAKDAAKIAAIGTGANVGMQAATGADINVKQALLGGIAGIPFSNPGRFSTAIERLTPASRPAVPALKQQAEPMPQETADLMAKTKMTADEVEAMNQFADERKGYNPRFLQEGDPEQIAAIGDKFHNQVARMRRLGVVPSEQDLMTLSRLGPGRDYKLVANEILQRELGSKFDAAKDLEEKTAGNAAQVAMAKAEAAKQGTVETLSAANRARAEAEKVAPNEEQVALARQAEAERQQPTTAEVIDNIVPMPTDKSAAESAAAMVARPKATAELDKLHKDYKARKAAVGRQLKLLQKVDESDPDYAGFVQDYFNMKKDLDTYEQQLLQAGGAKLLFGEQGGVPEGYSLPRPAIDQPEPSSPSAPDVPAPKPPPAPTETPAVPSEAERIAQQNAALRAERAKLTQQVANKIVPPDVTGQPIKLVPPKPVAAPETTALPAAPVKPVKATKPKMVRSAAKLSEVPTGTEIPYGGATAVKGTQGWFIRDAAGKEYPVTAKEAPAKIEAKAAEMLSKQLQPEASVQKVTKADLEATKTEMSPEAQVAKQMEAEQPRGLKVKINPKNKEGGFVRLPFDGEQARKKALEVIRPALRNLARASEEGRYVAGKIKDAYNESRRLSYDLVTKAGEAAKGLSAESITNVGRYVYARHNGQPLPTLNSAEQKALGLYDKALLRVTHLVSQPDTPWVRDFDASGKEITRRRILRPGWAPINQLSKEVKADLKSAAANPTKFTQRMQEYIDYLVRTKGIDDIDKAKDLFNRIYNVHHMGNSDPNAEFASLRYQEGLGIPESWINPNPFESLQHYINNVATDISFHRNMESDPIYAKLVGLKTNGRGEAIPDVVKLPSGKIVQEGLLSQDSTLTAIRRDFVGSVVPGGQGFEGLTHLVNSLWFGPMTQVKDIIGAAPALAEVLKPHEIKYLADGMKAMFSSQGRAAALRAGSARGERQLTPSMAEDLSGVAAKLGDLISRGTGSEQLAQAGRIMADGVGRAVAKARIAAKDAEFLDKWGPSNWKERLAKGDERSVIDHIAQEVANNVGGAYNATDLPAWLLRGQGNWFKPLFMVQRWSVGRMNRWIDNVYKPATKGNLVPLVTSLLGGVLSAGAINTLATAITDRKPKELTWEEYLRLGDKVTGGETAYTLASKANIVGYGGMLSALAFAGLQKASGEPATGFNNVLYKAIGDTFDIMGKYLNATNQGEADPIRGLLTAAGEMLRRQSQVYRLFEDRPDTGAREERIARRLGYMPSRSLSGEPRDPFSESAAYDNENVGRLSKGISNKLQTGQPLRAPSMAVRTTGAIRNGQLEDYYSFVRDAQGEAAAEAARNRDIERTRRRMQLYSTALGGR